MASLMKVAILSLLVSLLPAKLYSADTSTDPDHHAFEQARRLGRGVNLGNALEAPREGQWGVVLKKDYFSIIRKAGFDSIRVPIRWSEHAGTDQPYLIDEMFFERVDWVLEQAAENDLAVIINMHHYKQLEEEPDNHSQRFLALWSQISARYKDCPDTVMFEPLNEPCRKLDVEKWNRLLVRIIKIIRRDNPDRTIVAGPAHWNNIGYLDKLHLPADERNIIVSCHYYLPFHFTHQGAGWVGDQSNEWLGTTWTGSQEEKKQIDSHFDQALQWSLKNKRPIHIGEFGAYQKADMASRARWTAFVADAAEQRHFPWAYWEFCAGFGVYDKDQAAFRKPLLDALTSRPRKVNSSSQTADADCKCRQEGAD